MFNPDHYNNGRDFLYLRNKMIQRIQTIYLLLASIITGSLLIVPIYYLEVTKGSSQIVGTFGAYGLVSDGHSGSVPLYLLFILTTLMSITGLLLYKNRKKQILITRLNLVLQVLVSIAFLLFSFFGKSMLKSEIAELGFDAETLQLSFGVGYFLLFLGIPFLLLAIRGMRKDEELLRSIDRIR